MIHVAVSTGHSTAAGNRVNCHLFFPQATLFSKNKNVKSESKIWLCFVYWIIFCTLHFSNWESKYADKNEHFVNFARFLNIFHLGKLSVYQTLGNARKIDALLL